MQDASSCCRSITAALAGAGLSSAHYYQWLKEEYILAVYLRSFYEATMFFALSEQAVLDR